MAMARASGFVAVFVLIAAILTAQPPRNGAKALIESEGLRGWFVDHDNLQCIRNEAGTLTIAECAGWLRTDETIFGDYEIAFDVRGDVQTAGVLGLLGIDVPHRHTDLVVELSLLRPEAAMQGHSSVRVERVPLSVTGRAQALKPDGEWNSYVVTRNRSGVNVLLNGIQVASSGPIRASDGWIGFRATSGKLTVRDIRLRRFISAQLTMTRAKQGELIDGAYRPGDGVTQPKVRYQPPPQYTSDARARQIEGTVLLECIVGTNGSISTANVVRSLDPEFGLDAKAIEAAREWRFEPATRDGVPVPVWITIELTFKLKK